MIIEELQFGVIAWCAFALGCGGLIKGSLGVGTPLLTVPMLAMVLPPQVAVVIMAVPVVVANLWQVKEAGHLSKTVKRFWPAFLSLLAGTWVGVTVLVDINERALLILVGTIVILFTLFQGRSRKITISSRWEPLAGVGFCGASGIIGGLSSMFGPMLILFLVSLGNLSKNQFVGTISFLYVAAVVPWTVIMVLLGVLNGPLAWFSALATVPLCAGMVAGRAIRSHINERVFQRLVFVILLISGMAMILRGWNFDSTIS